MLQLSPQKTQVIMEFSLAPFMFFGLVADLTEKDAREVGFVG